MTEDLRPWQCREWQCRGCGYVRRDGEAGFRVLGYGLVECPKCGALHKIPATLELDLILIKGKERQKKWKQQ